MKELLLGMLGVLTFLVGALNMIIYLAGEYTEGGYLKEYWWLLLLFLGLSIASGYAFSEYSDDDDESNWRKKLRKRNGIP